MTWDSRIHVRLRQDGVNYPRALPPITDSSLAILCAILQILVQVISGEHIIKHRSNWKQLQQNASTGCVSQTGSQTGSLPNSQWIFWIGQFFGPKAHVKCQANSFCWMELLNFWCARLLHVAIRKKGYAVLLVVLVSSCTCHVACHNYEEHTYTVKCFCSAFLSFCCIQTKIIIIACHPCHHHTHTSVMNDVVTAEVKQTLENLAYINIKINK